MDRSTWKEKRRDAARKLAESKDRRAVPVLIKLAENETFDIIGEIAIEGLGTLGDPSAIPTLQKIVGDTARDKGQRDLARKSLAKLGGAASTPTPTPARRRRALRHRPRRRRRDRARDQRHRHRQRDDARDDGQPADRLGRAATGECGCARPARARRRHARGLRAVDVRCRRRERHVRHRHEAARGCRGDVSGAWQKRVERQSLAYGVDAGANVVAGFINPQGRAQTRGTSSMPTATARRGFTPGRSTASAASPPTSRSTTSPTSTR